MDHTEEQAEKLPVVTKITVQKKRKDRFNIFIDGEDSPHASRIALIQHRPPGLAVTK